MSDPGEEEQTLGWSGQSGLAEDGTAAEVDDGLGLHGGVEDIGAGH